jgi:hypothetical protein
MMDKRDKARQQAGFDMSLQRRVQMIQSFDRKFRATSPWPLERLLRSLSTA